MVKPFLPETFVQQAAQVLGEPDGIDPRTVLIVDDSEAVRETVRTRLSVDVRVVTAKDADEGIERYRAERPGVVLLDLSLQGVADGMFGELRRTSRSGLVALTPKGDVEARRAAEEAGYDAVLHKPLDQHELTEAVLMAASTAVEPADLLRFCLDEVDGYPVFRVPSEGLMGRVIPELQ